MMGTSMILGALGFALFFATCPVACPALYPFRTSAGLQTFFVSAMLGMLLAAFVMCARPKGVGAGDAGAGTANSDVGNASACDAGAPGVARSTKPGISSSRLLAAGLLYLLGMAGFEIGRFAASIQLLEIAAGLLTGAFASLLLLAWVRLLCTGDLASNLVGTGGLCAAGAFLGWLLSYLEGATLLVVHAALCIASVALLLAAWRGARCGAAPSQKSQDLPWDQDEARDDASIGDVISKMMSIAFVPLACFVVSILFASMSLFAISDRLTIFGLDEEMLAFVLAGLVIMAVGLFRPKLPLFGLLYRLILPICFVLALLFIAARQGMTAFVVTQLLIMAFISAMYILAIAIACTLSGTGEFEAQLVVGLMLMVCSISFLASILLSCVVQAGGTDVPEIIMSTCLALLLVYQIIDFWRDSYAPKEEDDQGSAAEQFRLACARISDERKLTKRESEIFAYLAHGYSPAYVADALTLSESTVRTHVKNIYRKLGVSSREELLDIVNEAVYAGAVPGDEGDAVSDGLRIDEGGGA